VNDEEHAWVDPLPVAEHPQRQRVPRLTLPEETWLPLDDCDGGRHDRRVLTAHFMLNSVRMIAWAIDVDAPLREDVLLGELLATVMGFVNGRHALSPITGRRYVVVALPAVLTDHDDPGVEAPADLADLSWPS
jgi:hypothetical protein